MNNFSHFLFRTFGLVLKMDLLMTHRLYCYYKKTNTHSTSCHCRDHKTFNLKPYRTPTQKVYNNLFLETLQAMRRNKA